MATPKPPELNTLIRASAPGWEGIPDSPNPFYIGFGDGLYQHRRSLIGRGVTKLDRWPASYPDFGMPASFHWDADPIPAKLMGQVVSFFETVYDYQHTEAAVLLVMHAETKEWRIFIPTQLLSHGGVNYVFDPANITYPWVLVGSIHSHCDFWAGHSGTDTGDADGFEGVHMTIGHIKRDIPEIVAMVAMNKKYVHYPNNLFDKLFDFSEAKKHPHPEWWERYCEDTKQKVKPVGFDLYQKFNKSTIVKEEKKQSGTSIRPLGPKPSTTVGNFNPADWIWDEDKKMMVKKFPRGASGTTYHHSPHISDDEYRTNGKSAEKLIGKGQHGLTVVNMGSEDWDDFYRLQGLEGAPEGYEGFDPQHLLQAGYIWDPEAGTWHWTSGAAKHQEANQILNESKAFNEAKEVEDEFFREQRDIHWEELIDPKLLDALMDSGMVNDDDIDFALQNPRIVADPIYWRENMLRKALQAVNMLRDLGMDIDLKVNVDEEQNIVALLPEPKPKTTSKGMN